VVESDPGYAQIFEIYSPGALGREGTNEAASAMRWLSRICCRFVHDALLHGVASTAIPEEPYKRKPDDICVFPLILERT
jgi:hypothetical protein